MVVVVVRRRDIMLDETTQGKRFHHAIHNFSKTFSFEENRT